MPMLRDEGPPVSRETIQEARRTLPVEYGYKIVEENGRRVLLVRSPRPKPDYLHELSEVALYVGLDEVRDVKDVLLIGAEKTVRLEPRVLRDHVRDQIQEDEQISKELFRRLDRNYAYTVLRSPSRLDRFALAVRIPRSSVSEIQKDDVLKIREALAPLLDGKLKDCQVAYVVADRDFERLGRRVFMELVGQLPPSPPPPPPSVTSSPPPAPKPEDPRVLEPSLPTRTVEKTVETEEYEVFVSKPKTDPPPPVRSSPDSLSPPKILGPIQDQGMIIEPLIEVHDEIDVLAKSLKEFGYEVVRSVQAEGETFEAAAHRPDGKRILIKRVERVDPSTVERLGRITGNLAADVCLVVSATVSPGSRLAAWGTPVVVFESGEISRISP